MNQHVTDLHQVTPLTLRVTLFHRVTAAIAEGKRPDPFRTRKLSPPAPMVLHSTGCGRVGHRRTHIPENPQPPPVGGFLHPTPPTPTAPHPATTTPPRHRRARNRQTRAQSPPHTTPIRARSANARAFAPGAGVTQAHATDHPLHAPRAPSTLTPRHRRARNRQTRAQSPPHTTPIRARSANARAFAT